jgi:hypothetical protein
MTDIQRQTILVDGLATSYLEAAQGDPVVASRRRVRGQLGPWLENNFAALSAHHHVLAPGMLGFGDSAKVVDSSGSRGMRIRHIAQFCEAVGVESPTFPGRCEPQVRSINPVSSDNRAV